MTAAPPTTPTVETDAAVAAAVRRGQGLTRPLAVALGRDEACVVSYRAFRGIVAVSERGVRWRRCEDDHPRFLPFDRWATRNAAELWERLATRGVIPAAWVGDPRRRFAPNGTRDCPRCGAPARVSWGCGACTWVEHPPTPAACVAFACDPAGVAAAEALAREIAAVSFAGSLRRAYADTVVWRFAQRIEPVDAYDFAQPECEARARGIEALGFEFDAVDEQAVRLACPEALR